MDPSELIKWREKNECSQGIMSVLLGVDVVTISRWERDVQKIPPFLHLALRHIEENRRMITDAVDRRTEKRRAKSERRQTERRMTEKSAAQKKAEAEKRKAARRRAARRGRERRATD